MLFHLLGGRGPRRSIMFATKEPLVKSSNLALGRIPSGRDYEAWNQGPVRNAPSPSQLQDMYARLA